MKLSIWRQFSSNHSGTYTIVGVFATPEDAKHVDAIIEQLVTQTADWAMYDLEQGKIPPYTLSPAEEELAKQYAVDWREPIDWLHPFASQAFLIPYQRTPQEHILRFDNLVIVDVSGDITWQSGHQFVDLLTNLGGVIYRDVFSGYEGGRGAFFAMLTCSLECTAPTDEIANHIGEAFSAHMRDRQPFARHTLWTPIPWITYHYRYAALTRNMPMKDFQHAEQVWIQEQQAWSKIEDELAQTIDREVLIQQKRYELVKQDPDLAQIIQYLRYETTITQGELQRSGRHSTFADISARDMVVLLPALTKWMRDLGCRVSYKFHQGELMEVKHDSASSDT